MQFAVSGNNSARCIERQSNGPSITQTCAIAQKNSVGNNYTFVEQAITQTTGDSQGGGQSSRVYQENDTGKNQSYVRQTIYQTTTESGAVVVNQGQTAQQESDLTQIAFGVDALPSLIVVSSPLYGLDPLFGEPGQQHSFASQSVTQDANAPNAVNGELETSSQEQNSSIDGDIFQTSPGVSRSYNHQDEYQNESASGAASQEQTGPLNCCTDQTGNDKDSLNIDQHARQNATSPSAGQTENIFGHCATSGDCDVDQFANQNGDHATNSCDGTICAIAISCDDGECTPSPPETPVCPPGEEFVTGEGCEPILT